MLDRIMPDRSTALQNVRRITRPQAIPFTDTRNKIRRSETRLQRTKIFH